MKRNIFLIGITSLMLAFGMAGCDSVATGAKKVLDGMTSYTIVLANVVNGATYTAVVYDSGEATGGGVAEAVNGSASIRLMPYNGKPAFSERTYQVRVSSEVAIKESASVAFVASGNTPLDWGTMTVISEGPDGEDHGKEMTSYTIVLANVVNGATYTAVVYDSGEATGGGVAEAVNGSASIRLTPYNGKPAFSERTYQVRVSSGAAVKEAASVAFVASGNTPLDWGMMTVISYEGSVLTVSGVEDGVSYGAEVYKYTKAVADAAALNGIISGAEPSGTGIGTAYNGTLEIRLLTPDGAEFTSNGKFFVVLKDAEDDSAPLKYKTFVRFIGGRATVKVQYDEDRDVR